MDYLQTDALSVGYNGKTLISKVALSVQRGRIVTLIGPNGSGKSTILKTIIGQLPSISGSVFLDGADMRSRSRGDVARRMAILMTARMDPELMTCRDVVSTGRYPYTGHLGVLRPEDKAIVEQSLRETDALDFADRPFQAVSDGQRQRILLAPRGGGATCFQHRLRQHKINRFGDLDVLLVRLHHPNGNVQMLHHGVVVRRLEPLVPAGIRRRAINRNTEHLRCLRQPCTSALGCGFHET